MAGSDSMQEKTEEATPRKREEAKREGQIPRSQEMNTAFILLGGAATVGMVAPVLGQTVIANFQHWMVLIGSPELKADTAVAAFQLTGWKLLAGMSTFLFTLMGITIAVNGVQARGVLSAKPLTPKWERVNPLSNIKRQVGIQPWAELFKSVSKMAIVGLAVYASIKLAWGESIALSQQPPIALMGFVKKYTVKLLTTAGLCYVALAMADYAYQLWQHTKNLRMTKEEVKQENKNAEGDPMIKARMRSMGRSLARRQMMTEVPNADVVVTNPTHIAVALKYDPMKSDAPMVLAMGQRKVAERIKQIAAENGVPMVENKPLARAMLGSCAVGRSIPAELYIAVAEVLAFVIRERGGRTAKGRA